jgi:hypothetical protein
MRLVLAIHLVALAAFVAGCGAFESPGTKLGLAQLPGKKLRLGFGVDCRNQDTSGCTGSFSLSLQYSFSDCAIVPAEVSVQGLSVAQERAGGWEYCPYFSEDDCQRYCWTPFWHGTITPVLDEIATSARIEMDDGKSTLDIAVDYPTAVATIALRGLNPGDAVADRDILIADLVPVAPMTPEEFLKDSAGYATRAIQVLFYQGNAVFSPPGSTMDLATKDGPWAFEKVLYLSFATPAPPAGPGTLEFTLRTNPLTFSQCPGASTCTGESGRQMLQFPVVYVP